MSVRQLFRPQSGLLNDRRTLCVFITLLWLLLTTVVTAENDAKHIRSQYIANGCNDRWQTDRRGLQPQLKPNNCYDALHTSRQ